MFKEKGGEDMQKILSYTIADRRPPARKFSLNGSNLYTARMKAVEELKTYQFTPFRILF